MVQSDFCSRHSLILFPTAQDFGYILSNSLSCPDKRNGLVIAITEIETTRQVKKRRNIMRKLGLILAVFLMTALYNITVVLAQTGNGAPNGPHYNLNIIGVSNAKTQPLTGGDRHTIFVGLGTDKKGG